VLSEMLPKLAVMVAVPTETGVAKPLPLTVSTDVFDELQVTWVVRSWAVPSENLPVAVNCWGNPRGMLDVSGFTDIAAKVRGDDGLLPQVVRDTAKDPRTHIVQKNLIFFMKTPPGKKAAKVGLRGAGS
jgi:hypothetical protein